MSKGLALLFTAETRVPKPYQVYWQVVNTGKEAKDAKGLRGEIFQSKTAGSGGLDLKQEEITDYSGTHWVKCFIVKDNICVACSGEFIVRIV